MCSSDLFGKEDEAVDPAVEVNGFVFLAECGARAGFEEMIRVPFPPGGAHRLWYKAGVDAGGEDD